MTDSFVVVNVSGLKELAAVCKIAGPELSADLYKALGAAGELVAARARSNAKFSKRIPGSIAVKRRGLNVKIQAGGDAAPDAAPFEHGGSPGMFRHPVFGNRENWVSQAAHPFLTPAVNEVADAASVLVLAAVDSALKGLSVV